MCKEFPATSIGTLGNQCAQQKLILVFQGAELTDFFEAGFIYFHTDVDVLRNSKTVIMSHGLPLLHSVWKKSN